jgi:4-hydroxy-tetrahydrodipicolinate reductase
MVKIGLLGYGKMGQAIEKLAESQGVQIVWRIRRENAHERTPSLLQTVDVVIEFSRPEIAFDNVMACLQAGTPIVSGTTGWIDKLPVAQDYCEKNGGALLWASNFSIGVNLFFALNRFLSQLMGHQAAYTPLLTETHHIHKLDAPSGTALTLAQDILSAVPRLHGYRLIDQASASVSPDELPIHAIREGEVPGTHHLRWKSAVDEINIEHRAYTREGFALGAIAAAKWIVGKQGVFTMNDVLNIR